MYQKRKTRNQKPKERRRKRVLPSQTEKMSRGEMVRAALGVIAVAGAIPLVLVAPGIVQASRIFASRPRSVQRKTTDLVLRRLADRGMARVFVRADGTEWVGITQKGKEELFRYELGQKILKQDTWDQLWRLVIFDVRESRDFLRRRLRYSLKSFGFIRLQHSVWIYPYECEEMIELVRTTLKIRGDVLYLRCARFRGDQFLCETFKLPFADPYRLKK